MIAHLEVAQALELDEHRLYRRHIRFCAIISLAQTVICSLYFAAGYFSVSAWLFGAWLALLWSGNLFFFIAIYSGMSSKLQDPSLSLGIILFHTFIYLLAAYFIEAPSRQEVALFFSTDGYRISVLMTFFASMLMASFRLNFTYLMLVGLLAMVGYMGVLLLAQMFRGTSLSLTVEWLQWLIFSMTTMAFVLTGSSINALRKKLSAKNRALSEGLVQVREMAIRDELTDLFNRRHIMEILRQQVALAVSGGYQFSICYVDIDYFKRINDSYGHPVGDAVLTRLSRRMREALREVDYIGRLGGEEFVLVLSQTGLQEALLVAQRVREFIEQTVFDDIVPNLRVTASLGVTEFSGTETIESTMARADAALYRAKSSGRNQVQQG